MRISEIFYFLLMGATILSVQGRRKGQLSKRIPIYRSLDEPTFNEEEDLIPEEPKLTLFGKSTEVSGDSRTLKHLLILNQLANGMNGAGNGAANGGAGAGAGAGVGSLLPYIILNNPSQLTNVNTNLISNTPPTTTTTTGAAGNGGTTDPETRLRMSYLGNSGALAYPVQLPTPVYQQRNQPFPQVVYGRPLKVVTKTVRRGNSSKKTTVSRNPFAIFANNFRRVQFL